MPHAQTLLYPVRGQCPLWAPALGHRGAQGRQQGRGSQVWEGGCLQGVGLGRVCGGVTGHPPPPCGPAVLMPALRPLLPLLLLAGLTAGASLPPGPGGHPGVCPNQLSPNLWVDAQSTCERECVGDQVSTGSAPPARLWGRPAPGGPRVSWGSGWSAPEEPRSHP